MNKSEVMNKQIDEIMDWFDFDKVHEVMTLLNWEWASAKGIPSIQEIRAGARARLREAADRGFCSTGGFTAQRVDDKDWVRMKLYFEVASWDVEGEDYIKEND